MTTMNRIKEIVLIDVGTPHVIFRDEVDVENKLSGKAYQPSYAALEILRRVARKMEVDFDFWHGSTTLRPRQEG
jgi:hypothetical protein